MRRFKSGRHLPRRAGCNPARRGTLSERRYQKRSLRRERRVPRVSGEAMPWFVYWLRCRDDSFYIGITTDVDKRVRQHERGQGPTYTARRLPVRLVGVESFETKQQAAARERYLKGLSRAKKEVQLAGSLRPPLAGSG